MANAKAVARAALPQFRDEYDGRSMRELVVALEQSLLSLQKLQNQVTKLQTDFNAYVAAHP